MYVYHLWRTTKKGKERCIGSYQTMDDARLGFVNALQRYHDRRLLFIVDSSRRGETVYHRFW
jgi:hypothetical protein